MINSNNSRIFNYINYFTLACIVPIAYFAPLGEWLLLSCFALSTIIKLILNNFTIKLYNYYILLISIFLLIISYFWSINPERTLEVILPTSGILISIYIILNISSSNITKNVHNIVGIPLLLTSLCIFLDLVFNTEIRSSLALLVGDKPTSISGNFSRGIIIISIILPISTALYIHTKKYILAFILMGLASTVVFLGPNESAKIALIFSCFSALIIYFLGPKSFVAFGIISLIIIIFNPLFSISVLPKIVQLEKIIEIAAPCTDDGAKIITNDKLKNNKDISRLILEFEKIKSDSPVPKKIIKLLNENNIKCSRNLQWQKTRPGVSIMHRFLIWKYVAKEISKKPILGHGIGTSRFIGQNIILNIPNTKLEIKGGIPLHPHNNFLEIWLELGLLGIIITSLLWINIIKIGTNIRKHSYVLGTGSCSSIVAIFVVSNLSFGAFQAWWMASIGLIFLVIFQATKYKN